jgi:hypothetical protein
LSGAEEARRWRLPIADVGMRRFTRPVLGPGDVPEILVAVDATGRGQR